MYMTPELRDGIFSIDPMELGADLVYRLSVRVSYVPCIFTIFRHSTQIEEANRQATEESKIGIVEVNEQTLSQLVDMGIPEHHARKALMGTKNGSLDAVFSYIEAHESDPEFNMVPELEAEDGGKKKRKKPRQIPLEIQRLFTQLKLIDQNAVSTHGRARIDCSEEPARVLIFYL